MNPAQTPFSCAVDYHRPLLAVGIWDGILEYAATAKVSLPRPWGGERDLVISRVKGGPISIENISIVLHYSRHREKSEVTAYTRP